MMRDAVISHSQKPRAPAKESHFISLDYFSSDKNNNDFPLNFTLSISIDVDLDVDMVLQITFKNEIHCVTISMEIWTTK